MRKHFVMDAKVIKNRFLGIICRNLPSFTDTSMKLHFARGFIVFSMLCSLYFFFHILLRRLLEFHFKCCFCETKIMILTRVIKTPPTGAGLLKFGPHLIQFAPITSRTSRGKPLCLEKPFPYNEKKFKWYHGILDNTMIRVTGENSKIIVVEGPIGVGKSAFCKALAEELEMHYIPQPTMDQMYIFPSGFDMREIDHLVPEEVRTYDHKNFCIEPKTWKAGWFQKNMLYLRFYQYLDALCHLFNTGQGVILERSYYSDYVFMLAMHRCNYVSKAIQDAYLTIKKNTSTFFLHPHLIIYLDIPVPVVQERIRTRNYSWEQNSPALTTQYLRNLENLWKQDYLRLAKQKAEILIYDWTDGGDVDVVIDDIEKLDFDIMRRDRKFKDWWQNRDELFLMRRRFTNDRSSYDKFFFYPWYKLDDIKLTQLHMKELDDILNDLPETKYDKGYNYLMGDSILSILFKSHVEDYRAPKFHLTTNKHWNS